MQPTIKVPNGRVPVKRSAERQISPAGSSSVQTLSSPIKPKFRTQVTSHGYTIPQSYEYNVSVFHVKLQTTEVPGLDYVI
ncbi:hypothetical protein CEXT_678191 [Caerostris extrusa]|uniref:Uncharacterized protein n=1 Tax=Caerostris extrusa TaxID=172846 RepID=A0AAV4TBN2_CAEEX|nr:hypothetical protein CEXT_678191 [Caerostris extrusa]